MGAASNLEEVTVVKEEGGPSGESRVAFYCRQLAGLPHWEPFLLRESGLPGPRGNIELAQAVATTGTLEQFQGLLQNGPDQAPFGTSREFLAVCGVVGLGAVAAQGDRGVLPLIRSWANDPRWRVREGVAMALQRLGDADFAVLLRTLTPWCDGSPLERRAVVAGLSEPRLLRRKEDASAALLLVEKVLRSVIQEDDRRSSDFLALRKGLGYGWSVMVAALPEKGKPATERWLDCRDPDVRWILKENLEKNRLLRMDPVWVQRMRRRLAAGPA
jgi:hypothetical protein